jgi:L-asparaginase
MPAHVLVVSCGGTISSVSSGSGEDESATPTLAAAELVAGIPGLDGLASLEARTFSVVPSAHTTLADVVELHAELRRFADEHNDSGVGIVVSQGTDTLEEVAFALDLLWDRATPLVLTGAMRNASLAGPDGPANLLAAVATAASPPARGAGVLVAFNDQLHAARYVRKSHTTNPATFTSPTVGPVGYVTETVVRLPFALTERGPTLTVAAPAAADTLVALLTIGIGDDGRLLRALPDLGYRGLVIEALGGGHLPPGVTQSPGLDTLLREMPVVLSSRTGAGEVLRATYAFAGSERDLLARGFIASGALDGRKSRVLLTLLLASGASREAVTAAFTRYG